MKLGKTMLSFIDAMGERGYDVERIRMRRNDHVAVIDFHKVVKGEASE